MNFKQYTMLSIKSFPVSDYPPSWLSVFNLIFICFFMSFFPYCQAVSFALSFLSLVIFVFILSFRHRNWISDSVALCKVKVNRPEVSSKAYEMLHLSCPLRDLFCLLSILDFYLDSRNCWICVSCIHSPNCWTVIRQRAKLVVPLSGIFLAHL